MAQLALLALTTTLFACAHAGPRFDSNVAAGFAKEPMRKLETPSIELYYPESQKDAAVRIVSRLEACTVALRGKALPHHDKGKLLVYLTHANFNNAYVQADYGGHPLQMVMPIHSTTEVDNFVGFGTVNQGNIGCHEAAHYVQNEESHGFWTFVNTVGGSLTTPSQGLERWFTEGLAVWTEGHTGLRTGRPASPFWYGVFEAAMTERGYQPRSGDLSIATSNLYGTGAYLTSYFFIDYLTRTYGESKIWELIDLTGGSIVSTFGIALRFRQVYGRTLGSLFDEFAADLQKNLPRRVRPATEEVLVPQVGSFARFAVSPSDGARVIVSNGYDDPPELILYERDGSKRFSRKLVEVLPLRNWIGVGATAVSGLRFSPDGTMLYAVLSVLDSQGNDGAELWALDAKNGKSLRKWELFGLGGDISPDGRSYVYIEIVSDTANLVELDLATGQKRKLTDFEPMRSLGAPAYSPDGQRIAFSVWNGEHFDLAIRESNGTISTLTNDGLANYGARWLDERSLLFLRNVEQRWQVFRIDIGSRALTPVTDVPHLAVDPMPIEGGRVAFLSREGVNFALHAAPIPSVDAVPAAAESMGLAPMPEAVAPPVEIISDKPYSQFDGLFRPFLHAPYLQVRQAPGIGWVFGGGLSVSGADRLGYHNYGADLFWDNLTQRLNFAVDYGFHRYAPWWVLAHVGRKASRSVNNFAESREVSLGVSRSFWDIPVNLTFVAFQQSSEISGRTLLVGPEFAFAYDAGEGTPYAGIRRGFRFGFGVGAFPAALGTRIEEQFIRGLPDPEVPRELNLVSLRASTGVTLPLPFSKRHSLRFDVTGRAIVGTDAGLLLIGGSGGGYALGGFCTEDCFTGSNRPLPGDIVTGSEGLRGYEDYTFATNRALINTLRYRYPFIIDRGLTSVAYALPSMWVSQINLDVFGTWAFMEPRTQARAVGAALSLFTLWGQAVPISVSYQFAYRFDRGLAPLHLIGLSY